MLGLMVTSDKFSVLSSYHRTLAWHDQDILEFLIGETLFS